MDRRDFLSHASFGLAAALASATAPAPAASSTGAPTTTKRDLVIAQASDLTSLDPHASTLSSDWRVAFNVFDTLIRRHADGTLHPALANTWKRTAPTRPAIGRTGSRRSKVSGGRIRPRSSGTPTA